MAEPINSPAGETPNKVGILHQFSSGEPKKNWREIFLPAVIILAIILAGTTTGYFLANRRVGSSTGAKMIGSGENIVSGPNEMGLKDPQKFPDKTQGRIEINDSKVVTEGSHKLVRPGGESQTAYLTSSVIDLNQFLGKCVEIWGETFAAQKAGWLLDVGYVKKLDQCPEGL